MDHRTKVLSVAVVIAGAGAAAWFLYLEEMVFGSDAPPVASAPAQKAASAPKPAAAAPKPAAPAPAPVAAVTPPHPEAAKPAPAPEPKVAPAPPAQPADAPKAASPVKPVSLPAAQALQPRAAPAAPKETGIGEMPAPKEIVTTKTPAYTAARDSGPRFNDLTTAVLYGDPKAVQELITFGKWVDKPDSRGVTPLMDAAQLGDAESAEVLLRAGADPNRPGPGGSTAMSIARERSDSGLTGLLGKYGGR
jgi:Ankyrin repeats (many copies)